MFASHLRRRTRWTAVAAVAVLAAAGAISLTVRQMSSQPDESSGEPWPFQSVSCSFLETQSIRAEPADPDAVSPNVTETQAAGIAMSLNPGATLLETKLIYLSSPDYPNAADNRVLRWAVSLKPAGGIYLSGGGPNLTEMLKIRPDGNFYDPPLTAEEQARLDAASNATVAAQRASWTEEYHLDFIDPDTGEWMSGAEGAR